MDVARMTILGRAERLRALRDLSAMDRLKDYGHSAAKAAQIHLDAVRGDRFALRWIAAACSSNDAKEKVGS